MQLDSPVFETVFTLSSLFLGGPGLSILYQDWGRDFAGETDSIEEQLLVTHLFLVRLCRWSRMHCGSAFSHPSLVHSSRSFCVARQSSFKTVYSHSSLWFFFFVKPKLSISEKDLGRALMGETHSNTGQQLVTHLLHKVQEYTALHNSPVSETVFTLFSMFFWCSRS